jgi:hypothetical protein
VISENPLAGTNVGYGSAVNLTVSTGPPVSVPNVVGLTQAGATGALTGAGLTVGTVSTASSATVPSGSVISENPLAGTGVTSGSAVNLTISTGPPPVSVPNVVGLTQAAATRILTGAGLTVGTVGTASSATVPSGSVISENPVAGASVAANSAVNLLVSTGPAPPALPSYNAGQLTLPTVVIGGATYSNMVITVGNILSGPNGTAANGSEDIYNPADNQMTIPAVVAGAHTYYNVIITVGGLLGIGSVTAADVYNGTELSISSVQVVGGTIYRNVVITPGTVLSVDGGMPKTAQDSYDPATGQLTISAVQFGNRVYTNVIITVAKVDSVG